MKKLHFVLVLTLLLPFCTLGNESSVDESSSNIPQMKNLQPVVTLLKKIQKQKILNQNLMEKSQRKFQT